MKRMYILSVVLLEASYALHGMHYLNALTDTIKNTLHHIKMHVNKSYKIEQTITNRMRAIPFMYLKEKYINLESSEISQEDINELNCLLIEKNKLSKKARIEDINNCLINYNEIYLKNRNEANNAYFLDTIMPTLLEGQDFTQTESESVHFGTMSSNSLLVCSRQNPYLMSCLFYLGNISFEKNMSKPTLIPSLLNLLNSLKDCGFIFNGNLKEGHSDQSHIDYIKAIFTPPTVLIQNIKKEAVPKIKTFLYCLNTLKKKSTSFKVPRPVINTMILYFIIKNAIPQKIQDHCNSVAQEAQEQIESSKNLSFFCDKKNHSNEMYNFLSHGFAEWTEKNMDIAWVTLQAMVFKK